VAPPPPIDGALMAEDRGGQNERTTLAWRRTNLAALAVSALAAKATHHPGTAIAVFGLAFGICAAVGWQADRRERARSGAISDWDSGRADPGSSAAAPLAVLAATGLTVGLAAMGVLIAFGA
jgi:uncharacterized membrane protein YidH (DUF202 family)